MNFHHNFLFVFLLTVFVIQCRARLAIDGDCLDSQSFDIFRYSPYATYDPNKWIDGRECARICSESLLPHAGVVGKKYCLCAADSALEEIKTIPKVNGKLCDDTDYYLRYYRGEPKGKIEKLTIKFRKEYHFIEEEVFVDLTTISNGNVEYLVDFGDGSDLLDWSPSTSIKHTYFLSGTYTITVQARLIDKPEVIIKQTEPLKIHYNVGEKYLKMSCPKVVEPDDKVDCNVTVIVGTDMQMQINHGDGFYTGFINLPGNLI